MKRKIICILLPIIIGIMAVVFLNIFLDKRLQVLLANKDLNEINVAYGSMYKDRGVAYNDYLMKNNYIALQGSSEFVIPISQSPTKIFPAKGMEKVVTNGRAYFQTLNHAAILGSENTENKDKKITLLLSLQWFSDKDGVDPKNFQANFAPVEFYKFLSNSQITTENKKTYASRVANLLSGNSQFAAEKLYAELYTHDDLQYKILNTLFKPYFICREYMINLKDKGLLYRRLKLLPQKKEVPLKEINWQEEYEKADEDAKNSVTNTDFVVADTYYNQYLKDKVNSYKNSKKDIDLMNSEEFADYELYLNTCVDLGIKPYIILIPTNGRWYDYTGMDKEKRDAFFNKAEQMAKEKGFEVLNLKDEEYTDYFMYDVMHLGWKGWLKVEEDIYKHYADK